MAENNNNGGSKIPSQFSHSVKLEQTAKGVRITVHVNADSTRWFEIMRLYADRN
jgi:hypothetical protein